MGDLVLKRGVDPEAQEWLGTALSAVVGPGFRLAPAVAAVDSRWVVDGWGATTYVPGVEAATRTGDWAAVVTAGRAFHEAVAGVPVPAFVGRRTDAWARADRAAWGEIHLPVLPPLAGIARRLRRGLLRAADLGPPRLVHGDLTGNVLLAPDEDPLVVDVSPYRRPGPYAEGVVVADVLIWHDPGAGGLQSELGIPRAAVVRALLFRVLTSSERLVGHVDEEVLDLEVEQFAAATAALGL